MSVTNNNEPFAFGDGTLMQLREQHWDFDELGTMMVTPAREPKPAESKPAEAAAEPSAIVPPSAEVFAAEPQPVFGEETKLMPASAAVASHETIAAAQPAVNDDPLARIEQRLEDLTRAVLSMQRRLDSIDQAMARFLTR